MVTAITPTPLGEGKTTTTVGLSQALGAHLEGNAHLHSPAEPGADVRHQGRSGGGRLQPDHSDGGVQSPPDRRHSRDHRGEQSAGRCHRHARLSRERGGEGRTIVRPSVSCQRKTGAGDSRRWMLRRLRKLGINKTNPNDLTPEERSRFSGWIWTRIASRGGGVDTNDRMLRQITIGQGPEEKGSRA